MKNIPWIEKYRPCTFDNIVFNDNNKTIFKNIIEKNYFPNILLYGPPGSGKTTTIINIINMYQKQNNCLNKELIIHLNASDERGIDIVRNQLQQFTESNSFFVKGIKFIILDEVDYMTKTAQHALKILIHKQYNNVRFCLICNYISKILPSLQNEFVKIHFNNLNSDNITTFLKTIVNEEKLNSIIYQKIKFMSL